MLMGHPVTIGSFTISLLHSEHKQGIVAGCVKATGALMPCRCRQFLVAAIAPATTEFKTVIVMKAIQGNRPNANMELGPNANLPTASKVTRTRMRRR
jgi:hypothetical protein